MKSYLGFFENNQKTTVFLFFCLVFFIGLSAVQDYGLSWDEDVSRMNGIVSLNYVSEIFNIPVSDHFGKVSPLHSYYDKDYGVAFELPLAYIEYLFDIQGRNVFYLRHFFTFLIFLLGTYSVYEMSLRRMHNWKVGLLAALLFIISPRIFAESFYNNKDIVFMATFAIAINYNIKFILNPTIFSAFVASFVLAFAIDVRIMGIILFLVVAFIFIKNSIANIKFLKDHYVSMLVYIILLILFIVAMWPWLWSDPLENFIMAFENMSKFRWDNEVLFYGDFAQATKLTWYYTLTWIAITTPPFYVILFLAGSLLSFKTIIINHFKFWKNSDEMQDYIFMGLFYLPILSVIILKSTLYDGWRQTYFVYPMFILISIYGFISIWMFKTKFIKHIRILLSIVLISSIGTTMLSMYKTHPHQNVYFNFLAGLNLKDNWELDYWGLSNRQALEYILKRDTRKKIVITPISASPLAKNIIMLDEKDRKRIVIAAKANRADYLINNFRGVKDNNKLEKYFSKNFEVYHALKYKDEIFLKIYKRKQ